MPFLLTANSKKIEFSVKLCQNKLKCKIFYTLEGGIMTFCLNKIKDYIKKDCIFIYESEKELKQTIKDQKINKKIFLIKKEDNVQLVKLTKNKDLMFLPCKIIKENDDMKLLLGIITNNDLVIVKGSNDDFIGYFDAAQLCSALWNQYLQLNAFLETILNTIDDSCSVIDKDGHVIYWTKGAEKIFSVKKEDIIGKPITNFFPPENLEILNTLKNGKSVYHMQHQAREDLVVLINSNPVYLENQIIGAVVSETDITSQILLNNELYHKSEKLFRLEKAVSNDNPFKHIRGSSPKLFETIEITKKAATTDANILIHGESGVGKELFAKAIHNLREEANAPFIAINCGAIPAALFESEIFGYEKGAFSGAHHKGKKGKVELARNGTLFLDEIGEMPLDMQVKILRLLQEKKFFPVGGTKEIEVDFRVVAATNRNLKQLVDEGKFREDLYYRLNVVSIEIPPLRERPEDIIELTHYFLFEISTRYNRPIHGISQEVMQALLQHNWPGNIRELKNVIERLVVFSENGEIKLEHLPFEIIKNIDQNNKITISTSLIDKSISLNERLQQIEKEIILNELEKVNGNKLQCAKNLQITRATLYNRLRKLGIEA